MSNTIIECRNKESDITVSNGDWTTVLNEAQVISDGDQIFVKNVFIDTQATSSQKIIIPEDLKVTLEIGYYKNLNTLTGVIAGPEGNAPFENADNYTLCIDTPSNDVDEVVVEELSFFRNVNTELNKAVDLTLTFNDFDDNEKVINAHIPANLKKEFFITGITGRLIKGPITYNPSLDVLRTEYNLSIKTENVKTTQGKTVRVPFTRDIVTLIPKGNYEPDDLCLLINNTATKASQDGTLELGQINTLCLNAKATQALFRDGNVNQFEFSLVTNPVDPSYYVNAMKNYTDTDNIWIGSNQFELAFDSATRNFQFNYLHMPYYYQKNLAVAVIRPPGLPIYTVSSLGGVYIKSFKASTLNADGVEVAPFDFWQGILGFTDSIIPRFSFGDKTVGPTQYVNPSTQLDEDTITEGLVNADALINKDTPTVIPTTLPFYSTLSTDQTRKIYAGNSVLDQESSFGYYVIEVGSKFKNNFYTPDNNYRNIQSIVSRYYELNSYTSGTAEGSLIYTHSGEPQLLESFRCRILNSDKVLANNIGDDNTIHISIVKAPPELPTETSDKKKK